MPRLEIVAVFETDEPLDEAQQKKMSKAMKDWDKWFKRLGAATLMKGISGKYRGMEFREIDGE